MVGDSFPRDRSGGDQVANQPLGADAIRGGLLGGDARIASARRDRRAVDRAESPESGSGSGALRVAAAWPDHTDGRKVSARRGQGGGASTEPGIPLCRVNGRGGSSVPKVAIALTKATSESRARCHHEYRAASSPAAERIAPRMMPNITPRKSPIASHTNHGICTSPSSITAPPNRSGGASLPAGGLPGRERRGPALDVLRRADVEEGAGQIEGASDVPSGALAIGDVTVEGTLPDASVSQ